MGKITAAQLVDCFQRYCLQKWGYVWGLNGELYTQEMAEKYKANKRSTSKWRDPETYWTVDCAKWIGKMAADCSGGIVSAIREYEPNYGDKRADTFFSQCTATGTVDSIPEIPGLCVWRSGHIGIYEGKGYVIEFRGTDYGCVRTRLGMRNFTHWGKLRDVDYGEETSTAKVLTITSPLMRGEDVQALQTALNALGYSCGDADGICGEKTMEGIKAFVAAHSEPQAMPDAVSVRVTVGGREYKGDIGG